MINMKRIKKNNKGFTLIELMIAMTISGIIIALTVNAFLQQEDQNITQNQVTEIQQNARAGFHMIISEIRMAGFDPTGNYGTAIIAAGTGALGSPLIFTYVADNDCIDNDGDAGIPNPPCTDANVDEPGELKTVTINLFDSSIDSGVTLDEIQISAAGQPIAENIAALQFTYFDSTGTQIAPGAGGNISATDIPNIKAVQVLLTARPDETERDLMLTSVGNNRTLESMIKCRNL